MPRRVGPVVYMERLSIEERLREPSGFQAHWYRLVGTRVRGYSVLDVGAADGYGMDIMREAGADDVRGIDPLPLRADVAATPLAEISDKSVDIAVACDVIEHVEDDVGFLRDLLRVAREFVFFSTPNWKFFRAGNKFHVREYTPKELRAFLGDNHYEAFTSDDLLVIRPISNLSDAAQNFGIFVRRPYSPAGHAGS